MAPKGRFLALQCPDVSVDVDGRRLLVRFRPLARAVNLTLRLEQDASAVIVTHPLRVSRRELMSFVDGHAGWIRQRLRSVSPCIPFTDGQVIPLLGMPRTLCIRPEGRRGIAVEEDRIVVTGPVVSPSNRLRDWLRQRALQEIRHRAFAMADRAGRRVRSVSVRDTRSRWGSCSATGDLSFSWRLILAPEPVLAYVVAHEVAHLVEMNHSRQFWSVVDDLFGPCRAERDWLRHNGPDLHRYGAPEACRMNPDFQ